MLISPIWLPCYAWRVSTQPCSVWEEERKARKEELAKQKLVDLAKFKEQAKKLNAAYNKKF